MRSYSMYGPIPETQGQTRSRLPPSFDWTCRLYSGGRAALTSAPPLFLAPSSAHRTIHHPSSYLPFPCLPFTPQPCIQQAPIKSDRCLAATGWGTGGGESAVDPDHGRRRATARPRTRKERARSTEGRTGQSRCLLVIGCLVAPRVIRSLAGPAFRFQSSPIVSARALASVTRNEYQPPDIVMLRQRINHKTRNSSR